MGFSGDNGCTCVWPLQQLASLYPSCLLLSPVCALLLTCLCIYHILPSPPLSPSPPSPCTPSPPSHTRRHWANLEYGCSAGLSQVSLPHWNQDEEWGGFGGPHAMVVGGFDAALKGLAQQLGPEHLRLSCPVASIDYTAAGEEEEQQEEDGGADKAAAGADDAEKEQQQQQPIKVTLVGGEVLQASLVLVTVPLGVLQAGGVQFEPPLPEWKAAAAHKLGFGDLNKVVMQVRECSGVKCVLWVVCSVPLHSSVVSTVLVLVVETRLFTPSPHPALNYSSCL